MTTFQQTLAQIVIPTGLKPGIKTSQIDAFDQAMQQVAGDITKLPPSEKQLATENPDLINAWQQAQHSSR